MIKNLLLMFFAILGLTACTVNTATLPLAEGKPTLLFFYTEG